MVVSALTCIPLVLLVVFAAACRVSECKARREQSRCADSLSDAYDRIRKLERRQFPSADDDGPMKAAIDAIIGEGGDPEVVAAKVLLLDKTRRDLANVRASCGHWCSVPRCEHADPCPCASWDECLICGAAINFRPAMSD